VTIFNLGSINIDKTYRVPHLPAPGETLAATAVHEGLGGKGANMSVAAARAAARVVHVGAIGADGRWTRDRLMEYGVDTRHIAESTGQTGHAVIAVAEDGENQILIWPGVNGEIAEDAVAAALVEAQPGDWLLLQNETNAQAEAARMAREQGLRVLYAAAPFNVDAVQAVLPDVDLLVLNAVEGTQLTRALRRELSALGVEDVVVTLGSEGCRHLGPDGETHHPAFPATVRDTTGAGDTFTGYLAAGLDRGQPMAQAIRTAQRAGALMVAREGTADVIPDLREVQDSAL
jgi:ribokinase